jgi:hypothetical protein
MNIPVNSITGYIGLALLALGGFMILAGLDIISVQQVTVKRGRRTWAMGIIFALLGLGLLLPEFRTTTPTTGSPESPETPLAATTASDLENPPDKVSESSIKFNIPNTTLWSQTEDSYTTIAKPEGDSIAWSDEIFAGDFTLTAEVTHTSSHGEATFIVYGNGIGFSDGCLIIVYGNGFAKIEKHSIYHAGENWLAVNSGDFYLSEAMRAFTIEVTGGKISLYVDGLKVASAFLTSEINNTGRIGLLEHWETPAGAAYSNIKIKSLGESK